MNTEQQQQIEQIKNAVLNGIDPWEIGLPPEVVQRELPGIMSKLSGEWTQKIEPKDKI